MMMETTIIRPLPNIVGYGNEVTEVLRNFASASEPKQYQIKTDIGEWLDRNPFAKHFCFVDITFFPELKSASAQSFVISPSADRSEIYKRILRKFVDSGHALAAHPVFRAGCPYIMDHMSLRSPETEKDLEAFYDRSEKDRIVHHGSLDGVIHGVDDGSLFHDLGESFVPTEGNTTSSPLCVAVVPSYGDQGLSELKTRDIANRPLREHWDRWVTLFAGKRLVLKSSIGGSLRWLAGIPIGFRRSSSPRNFTLVAAVFVGFDGSVTQPQVDDILRYILLRIYRTDGLTMREEIGRESGQESTFNAFAHQIRETAAAVRSGWLVSQQNWERAYKVFSNSPDHTLRTAAQKYKIAPVPELFSATATTLAVWAQGRRWQDLFTTLPNTLRELMGKGFDFAKQIRFAAEGRTLNLNDDAESQLPKLWERQRLDFLLQKTHLHCDNGVELLLRSIQPAEQEAQEKYFFHLCELLRLFVALFDNYMGRGDTGKPVSVECEIEKKMYLLLLRNSRRQEDSYERSNIRPGVRGKRVIETLLRDLSGELLHWDSDHHIAQDQFVVQIRLPLFPVWTVNTSDSL
jgi:hypothetical protein